MRMRTTALAVASILGLVLTGCGSSISGTAQADPRVHVGGGDSYGDLSDLEGSGEDLGLDGLGDLLDGLSDGDAGDLSGLMEGLLGGDLSDLQDLDGSEHSGDPSDLEGLGDLSGLGDLGAFGELLGGMSGGDFGGGAFGDCLSLSTIFLNVGTLMIGPSMGQPLTQEQVDKTFNNFNDAPAEIQGPLTILYEELSGAVGKSGQAAMDVMDSPRVEAAMDAISDYGDAACDFDE